MKIISGVFEVDHERQLFGAICVYVKPLFYAKAFPESEFNESSKELLYQTESFSGSFKKCTQPVRARTKEPSHWEILTRY